MTTIEEVNAARQIFFNHKHYCEKCRAGFVQVCEFGRSHYNDWARLNHSLQSERIEEKNRTMTKPPRSWFGL